MKPRRERDASEDQRDPRGTTPWPVPAAPQPTAAPGTTSWNSESAESRALRDEFMSREEAWKARADALRTHAIRTADRLDLLRDVGRAVSEAPSSADALQSTLRLVCRYAGFSWAHAWILDRGQGGPLGPAVAWYSALTAPRARFRAASFRTDPRADTGMIHAACSRNRPEWARSLETALPGRWKEAEESGVRVAVAYPADVEGEVVAVLEYFSDADLRPPEMFDETMADIGRHIAETIERRRLQRESSEKLREWHRGLARELHDNIGQELTGLTCLARALSDRLRTHGGPDARDAAHLAEGARRVLEKTRIISRGFIPVGVEVQSLVHAFRDLTESLSRDSGVSIRFEHSENAIVEGRDAAWHLFRIAQEALTNAIRHADAGEISLGLWEYAGTVVLEIADDGRGLSDADLKQGGSGIGNMRYRAGLIGATLVFAPGPRRGTMVVCALRETRPELTRALRV